MRNNVMIRFCNPTIPYLTLVAALFVLSDTASAELLCIKRSQPLAKGELRLSRAVKVVSTDCPNGFASLLDTSTLQGAAGSNGKSALGKDNCTLRNVAGVKVNTSADRRFGRPDVTCNPGEFVHSATNVERVFQYSADWSIDGDASAAGSTVRVPITGAAYSTPVTSSTGLLTGFQYDVGGQYGNTDLYDAGTITGSITSTNVYSFLCCTMSE